MNQSMDIIPNLLNFMRIYQTTKSDNPNHRVVYEIRELLARVLVYTIKYCNTDYKKMELNQLIGKIENSLSSLQSIYENNH